MKPSHKDKLNALERAIADQYGDDAVADPRDSITPINEMSYKAQKKQMLERESKSSEEKENVQRGRFLISKNLLSKEKTNRKCPVCDKFSFNFKDDVYMLKFGCCLGCYINNIEGRSENENIKKQRGTEETD